MRPTKLALCTVIVLAAALLAGCYAKVVVLQEATRENTQPAAQTAAAVTTPAPVRNVPQVTDGTALKTGLSFITSTTSSTDGTAQSDVNLVAVAVDENGVIVDCYIDSVQAKVSFDGNGNITSDITAPVMSKNELGADYGMARFSPIGKEWDEQVAYLASYVIGKTADEVSGIAFTSEGKPEDVDLASSVTIYMGGYISGIVDAVNNAEYRGAKAGDRMKLVTLTSETSSKSATADAEGLAQSDTTVALLTLDGSTITSCYIDAVQAKVNFDNTGKITSELSADVQTKNELGENYGMHMASSIGSDWYTQTAAYCDYVTGKKLSEVTSIAVTESTKPADADLSSSVTMSIGDFQTLMSKAAEAVSAEIRTGLSFITSTTSSTDGTAQSDVNLVAVAVDENGVIVDCYIDSVQAKVSFDGNGNITSDITAPVRSKNELGADYGMARFSPIGKEWDEQVAYLASYVIGKTADEVSGIAFTSEGKPEDVDLASSVTIYMGGYISGIVDAVNNAEYRGAKAGDRMKLVTLTSETSSKSAAADAEGLAQSDTTVALLTLDGSTITSCYIDAVQAKVNFDNTGKITSELSSDVQTKNELGDAYGMRRASSIGAEWNEQAAAFSAYVTGKTLSDVSSIAVTESTKPADADLSSSVTISIGSFQSLIAKASN